ncbi:hypothetical protein QQF64_028198 [Cirrhinus molitorella]|uniref:Uncharacterized protein n=1 Tax=Cirrhinus molitorella TaxID=172907 RepID=A0ABR3N622_9TELE
MGVCASSSSHIVKASWRSLVGDVKPQERGEKEKAQGRKWPSLFHEHTHALTEVTYESAEYAGMAEQDLCGSLSERNHLKAPDATLISYPSCASSNIRRI